MLPWSYSRAVRTARACVAFMGGSGGGKEGIAEDQKQRSASLAGQSLKIEIRVLPRR